MKKIQVFFIHGAKTLKNQKNYLKYLKTRDVSIEERIKWHNEYLKKKLGKRFQVIKPRMPSPDNAKYSEWKIHFERYIPKLKNNIILIGESLGGIFLAKYLSEHKFPRKILSTYLVCAPYDDTLPTEDLAGGFKLRKDLTLLEKNTPKLTLIFARKDDVVPVSHAEKYRKKLKNAKIKIYNHIQGHFKVSKFPEIVKMIKEDAER